MFTKQSIKQILLIVLEPMTHTYILINYNNSIDDVLTVAGEIGYAINKYYTNKFQSYIYSQHKAFIADISSNVNQTLVLIYMIKQTNSRKKNISNKQIFRNSEI